MIIYENPFLKRIDFQGVFENCYAYPEMGSRRGQIPLGRDRGPAVDICRVAVGRRRHATPGLLVPYFRFSRRTLGVLLSNTSLELFFFSVAFLNLNEVLQRY